jgi:hypothetical protein
MIGNAEKRAIPRDVGRPYGREVRLLELTNDDQLAREKAGAFRSDAKKVIKAKKRGHRALYRVVGSDAKRTAKTRKRAVDEELALSLDRI